MQPIILIIHTLAAMSVIALVLVQYGKGADAGAAFGSGSSNTMFGSVGPASFLMKLTVFLAAIFFATSIGLSYLITKQQQSQNSLTIPSTQTVPSAPVGGESR